MNKMLWFDKSILHTVEMDKLYAEIEQMYITIHGVPSYRQAKYAISCMVANLVYSLKHNYGLYVSRSKATYSPQIVNGETQSLCVGYSSMVKLLTLLEDHQIIESVKGHAYFCQDTGDKLHSNLGYIKLTNVGEELIMSNVYITDIPSKQRSSLLALVDSDKQPMEFEQTPETAKMVELVQSYNEFMSKQEVVDADGDLLHTALSRVFSRGDVTSPNQRFTYGGRFYAEGTSYQLMPQMDRKRITINNEPVFELDFRSIHISIYCSLESITLPEGYDVYSHYDTDNYVLDQEMLAMCTAWYKQDYNPYREFEKLAWLVLINCGKRNKTVNQNRRLAIDTLKNKLKEDKELPQHLQKFIGLRSVNVEGVISHIENSSLVAKELLYSDRGIELMKLDSDIMQQILTDCVKESIPVLCVHDSIVVPQSRVGLAMQIMKYAYGYVCGTEDNCVITIK